MPPRYKSLGFMGFMGYRVGRDGSVWTQIKTKAKSSGRGVEPYLSGQWRKLKPIKRNKKRGQDYLVVTLNNRPSKSKSVSVHLLVLEAFVGQKPDGMQCLHKNGKADDNRLSNLRWGTSAENAEDRKIHGRATEGERHGMAKVTIDIVKEIRETCKPRSKQFGPTALGRKYGLSRYQVWSIWTRRSWKCVP